MNDSTTLIQELATLLVQGSYSVDFDADAEKHTQTCISLKDFSRNDAQSLREVLEKVCAFNKEKKDYSPYFKSIIGSPMYKPANPLLAIQHTAKAYNLDVNELKKSFMARR